MSDILIQELFKMQDMGYRDFHARLIPDIKKDKIIGIRTPQLRSFAKEFGKSEASKNFISNPKHEFYEENNLHAFLIEQIKDFDECVSMLEKFLPYVDNWATCDLMQPKVLLKNKKKLFPYIKKWICASDTFTIRFGVKMLMNYLDDEFDNSHLEMVKNIKSDEYYVKMVVAWYFATALAKRYEESVLYIENRLLDKWTHNKSIQKAVESYRIPKETKEYLKSLKIQM